MSEEAIQISVNIEALAPALEAFGHALIGCAMIVAAGMFAAAIIRRYA